MVASVAPAGVPNVSASDMTQMENETGTQSYGAGTNQGLGSSYLSLLPGYLQMSQAGQLPSGGLANDPAAQWLMNNGYLQGDLASNNITGGYKAEGVSSTGQYNPTDPMNIGAGYGSDQGNQNMVLSGPNPFGYSTIGSQDVHELTSPTQNPSAFGTSAYGTPTVDKGNLASNQDWISKYLVPGMQLAASAAFGGGLSAITSGASSLGMGVYNMGSGIVQGLAGGASPAQVAENVGAGLAGNALAGAAGANGIPSSMTQFVSPAVRAALAAAQGQQQSPYQLVGPAVKLASNLG